MTVPVAAARYTLRKHAATPYITEAAQRGARVVRCGIGDPTAFRGIKPFPPFVEALRKAHADHFGYAPSTGRPELREAIREFFIRHGRTAPVNVFLGAGISGIGNNLFRVIFEKGDGVAIPRFSYILYHFHAAMNGLNVQSVRLNSFGVVDVSHLERRIDASTRMVVITTPGNPIGTCVPPETFRDIIRIVNDKERQFNHPIFLVADVIYEPFRRNGPPLDPLIFAQEYGRIGPTLLLDSLSKVKIVAPGARIGWAAVEWPEGNFPEERKEFLESLERLLLPSLGEVPTPMQYALLATLQGILANRLLEVQYMEFTNAHIREVHARLDAMLAGLAERGMEFPAYYYHNLRDPSRGVNTDHVTNSLYLNFGMRSDENTAEDPFAARLARNGLEHGTVIASTPLSSFVPEDQTAGLEHFTRITALCDPENQAFFFQALDHFLEDNPGARP